MRLLTQVSNIAKQGHQIILVHGGGKSLNRRLSQMQMTSEFVEGLRKTDADTLQAAVMVLAGEVNKKIVAELSRTGTQAVGICGADAEAVQCTPVEGLPGYPPGIGFVGKPTEVNKSFFELMLNAGLTPVVSSIALGADCQLYNVNADQMASACASGVDCTALIYLTDVPGVRDENGSVLNRIGEAEILSMRSRGVLSGGMLPKTSSCLEALAAGVESVHILPGSSPDVLTRFVNGTLREGTSIHGKN
jgi:acetylglutamate kinase